MSNHLLIALGGATGSGKTALAIELAQNHPQLVILSADSRQIYKQLDVGSAKVGRASTDSSLTGHAEPAWVAGGVSQFLIDIAEPGQTFTLTDYQREAYRLIHACWDKGKIPFIVGGTVLYLQAVIEGYTPEGAPDHDLRAELESLQLEALVHRLVVLGGSVPETDAKNKRRVIRAIERVMQSNQGIQKRPITSNSHTFVLQRDWEEQRSLAPDMVQERLDLGLIEETKTLLSQGIDKQWLMGMGLSYRLVIRLLDGEFSEADLFERMVHEFRQLMRRQRTWFNRMPHAIKLDKDSVYEQISQRVEQTKL